MKEALVDLHCYAIQYSPFFASKLALVASQNFGLTGKGSLYIFESQGNQLILEKRFQYENGIYNLGWSEFDPHIIATVSSNGYIQIWNCTAQQALVTFFKGHECEINSIVWNLARDKPLFCTGSWDHTIKLWDSCCKDPLLTLSDHNGIVYGLSWSPHLPAVILSCSGDGSLRTWDLRNNQLTNSILAGSGEILSCDWTKYDSMIFVSSGTDSTLKVWDLRKCVSPLQILIGHGYPARCIKSSPHKQGVMASASYDKTTRIWDYLTSNAPIANFKHHSEFVTGIDFSLHNEREIVDCSWDKSMKVFNPFEINL